MFDEFAAAFQFPLAFGENWDAFNDFFTDLDLPPGLGYVVVITEPELVLDRCENKQFQIFVRSMNTAAEEWRSPIELGEWWDRPAVPFHVVLAGGRESLMKAADRWTDAGIPPVAFDITAD